MNTTGLHYDLGHGPYSVYLFEFPDGKTYVGKCKGKPEKRWRGKYNKRMKEAFRQAGGRENVTKTVLRTGLNGREVLFFEGYYAAKYHAYTNGYNIHPAGSSGAVLQIDKETFEPIARWDSVYQAEKALGIPHNNIIAALHGRGRHSAGGFHWCYANALCLPEHLQRIMDKAAQKAATTAAECSTVAEKGDDAIDNTGTTC